MATDDNSSPAGQGKIPDDALAILAECTLAAETVAAGLERVSGLPGLPRAVQDELTLLKGLAKQLTDAFENLRDWLLSQYGAGLAGLAEGGGNGQPQS